MTMFALIYYPYALSKEGNMTCFLGQILNPRTTCFFGTEGVHMEQQKPHH